MRMDLVFLATVILIGLNLRPFITAVGPLSGVIGTETGLGLTGLSLLTLIPILMMGIMAFAAPFLQSRIGAKRLVLVSLVILSAGSGLRFFVTEGWQIIVTAALLGVGAAIIQALFPGIVKHHFPERTGVVMGLYSAMLMGGGALGARVAGSVGDWHTGLGWIAVLPLVGLVLATIALRATPKKETDERQAALLSRPRVWLLMGCFGLVNGGYSSVVAWLAPFYQELGYTAAQTGNMLAVLALSQAASALTLPVLARRGNDRRGWLYLTLTMQAVGFLGLIVRPDVCPMVLAATLGAGLGGCFSLCMIVALEHARDAGKAGTVAALMQGGGFLLAALPPFVLARIHGMTGGFAAGWMLHLGCVAVVAVLVMRLAPRGYARALDPRTP